MIRATIYGGIDGGGYVPEPCDDPQCGMCGRV